MRVIRSTNARFSRGDAVFRQSARAPAIGVIVLLLSVIGVALAGFAGGLPVPIAGLMGFLLLVFGIFSAVMLRRARSPGNWILACDENRALVKLRSYLNAGFPPDIPHILELPLARVESARATLSELRGLDSTRTQLRESRVFLDIRVTAGTDLTDLRQRLEIERNLRINGRAWRHYPVTVADERTIRVEWRSNHARIVPDVESAIRLLGGPAYRQPSVEEGIDIGGTGPLPDRETAMRQVGVLVEQGRVMEATLLGKRALGWSTTEAKRFIEQSTARQTD